MIPVIYISGGCRSGKSQEAEKQAMAFPAPRAYIATAEIFDHEMQERVRLHRQQRGDAFHTREAPINLAAALHSLPTDTGVALVDCLTVWLGNLFHHQGEEFFEDCKEIREFLDVLRDPPCPLILEQRVGDGNRPRKCPFPSLSGCCRPP
ncbi:MAG: bifunctional adenosylcobinamide kinase/adenosylcobinamide-phosphate guanylyltransferase [Puniceicoccales bacterium]